MLLNANQDVLTESNIKGPLGVLENIHAIKGRHSARNWLRGRDLNPRPSGYEPDELPGCSTPRVHDTGMSIVRKPKQLILAISDLRSRCNLQPLDHRPIQSPSELPLQTASDLDVHTAPALIGGRISSPPRLICIRFCDSRTGDQPGSRSSRHKRMAYGRPASGLAGGPMDAWTPRYPAESRKRYDETRGPSEVEASSVAPWSGDKP